MEILCVFNQIILDNMKIYDFSNNYKINGRFENVLFINFWLYIYTYTYFILILIYEKWIIKINKHYFIIIAKVILVILSYIYIVDNIFNEALII